MKGQTGSDAYYLMTFFALLIAFGTFLLCLPAAWTGTAARPGALPVVDALFIATSAVCVTGLSTVDTADFTRFGQVVILLLIQFGGLGIISFTSILLTIPGGRLPLRRLKTIRSFYVDGVEYRPAIIVRSIIFFTLLFEGLGALALGFIFRSAGVPDPVFAGVFHSVSAFCNAGFSLNRDSLESFAGNGPVLAVIASLVVLGGIGFIVIQDIERRWRGKRNRVSYHSKVVLTVTAFLIAVPGIAFFLIEGSRAYAGMGTGSALANAFFQAVMPRTAGFDSVLQASLSQPSKVLTLILMFIGGAPGSIAGGIKVTTAFVVAAVMLRRPDPRGDITVFRSRLSAKTCNEAVVYFLKAAFLLILSAGFLSFFEGLRGAEFSAIVFESVSAFGTVGLTVGLTPALSWAGKLVVIGTMFAGRVGLIAIAFPAARRIEEEIIYPEGSILLG